MTQHLELGLSGGNDFVLATDVGVSALNGYHGCYGRFLNKSFISLNVFTSLNHCSPTNTFMRRAVLAAAFAALILTTLNLPGADTNRVQDAGRQARPHPRNREALLAVVNGVTVLDFDTDRPVRQARLLVNGRVVDTTGAGTTVIGLKVAAIPGATNIAVHLQVPSMGWLLHGAYPNPVRADLLEEKRYGPGKHLVLTNWTEVFGIRQTIGTNVIYTMSVEAK